MMGKIYVVGIGPGGVVGMTQEARMALERADVLCGYTVYIELVRDLFPNKEIYTTPMRRELDRCRWALERAVEDKTVVLICSGDAGIYGMASPLLEMAADFPDVEVEIIPGVTAALSGAALLGAPLGHDFCVISLSDLLTPWEVIERRLNCAARGDFAVCLYNPSSKKRTDHLRRACDILLRYRAPDTPCGWTRNIGRKKQETRLLTLTQLREEQVDMLTTVFVGNSATEVLNDRLVTPRGYQK